MSIKITLEARNGKWVAVTSWDAEFGQPFENRLVLITGARVDYYLELDTWQAAWQTINGAECIVCYGEGHYKYVEIGEKAVERRPVRQPRKRRDGRPWVWRNRKWEVG